MLSVVKPPVPLPSLPRSAPSVWYVTRFADHSTPCWCVAWLAVSPAALGRAGPRGWWSLVLANHGLGVLGGVAPCSSSGLVWSPFVSFVRGGWQSAKKIGDDIAKETLQFKGLRVTVKLTVQNRVAQIEVVPTTATLLIKHLAEPERDRKKVKNSTFPPVGRPPPFLRPPDLLAAFHSRRFGR